MEAVATMSASAAVLEKTAGSLPAFGLGCAVLGNLYAAIADAEVRDLMAAAWERGVRYYDTAPLYGYGLSERRLGDALREHPRASYCLSTKVGRLLLPDRQPKIPDIFPGSLPFSVKYDYTYDGIMRSFEHSLQRIGTDYIDILLVHDLGRITHGEQHARLLRDFLSSGYRALAELRAAKCVHAIGLGVNEWEVCLEVLAEIDLDCIMLAGRYTLLEQEALEEFFPVCLQRNISIIAAGPYNSGILATSTPEGGYYNYQRADQAMVARAQAIGQVCQEFDVALPEAAIQFPGMHAQVSAVVAGLHSAEQVFMTEAYRQKPIPAALWTTLKQRGLLHKNASVREVECKNFP